MTQELNHDNTEYCSRLLTDLDWTDRFKPVRRSSLPVKSVVNLVPTINYNKIPAFDLHSRSQLRLELTDIFWTGKLYYNIGNISLNWLWRHHCRRKPSESVSACADMLFRWHWPCARSQLFGRGKKSASWKNIDHFASNTHSVITAWLNFFLFLLDLMFENMYMAWPCFKAGTRGVSSGVARASLSKLPG